MKIVISADIEGASGVVNFRQTGYPRKHMADPQSNPDYVTACRLLTGDINAAVEGAIEAGATEFVVHDSHGMDYCNVLIEELHPAVEVVRGMPVILYECDDLKNMYDASFLIGMHARANQPGVLSHVFDWPSIREVRISGVPVGESQISAALCGYFGCPAVLITGDDLVCNEIREWSKGLIETAVVKKSISRYSARCLPLDKSRKIIKEAACIAVKKIKDIPCMQYEQPIILEMDFNEIQTAGYASWMPQVNYDGKCMVSYTSDDFFSIYKVLVSMFRLGRLD